MIDNLLIRPQLLDRTDRSDADRLASVFLELLSRLMRDAAEGGTARNKLMTAVEGCMQALLQEIAGRLDATNASLRAFLQPFLDRVQSGINLDSNADNATGVLQALAGLLGLLEQTLQSLTAEQLGTKLHAFADIIEQDLGITSQRMGDLLRACVDESVDQLTADYLGGDHSKTATNAFVIGSQLSELKTFLLERLPELGFNHRELLDELTQEVRKSGWNRLLAKISEVSTALAQGVGGLGQIFNFSPTVTASAGTTPGAAPVNTRGLGVNTRGMRSATDLDPMSWYASWFFGEVKMVDDRFKLEDEAFFNQMSFKESGLSPEFLEHWAYLTNGMADLSEGLLHGLSIEKGDWISNLANLLLQASKGTFTLAAYGHQGADWEDVFKVIENGWVEYLTALGITLATSAEGAKAGGDSARWIYWATLAGADVTEMFLYAHWTTLAREFSLSLFTLINSDPNAKPQSKNFEKVGGFAQLFAELGSWIAAFYSGRKAYGFPLFDTTGRFVMLWIFGWLTGFTMLLIGLAVAGALAGKHHFKYLVGLGDDESADDPGARFKVFAVTTWRTLLSHAVKWPIYNYLVWDGATDNGRLGIDKNDNDNIRFAGYPDAATTPYLLPYKPADSIQCAQGHLGIWSHNVGTSQIYAVDFAHDEGQEVLASRGGTVVHYFDAYHDNRAADSGNGITIRHDDPEEGVLPNQTHDKDHLGVKTTYMTYYHGRHFGVRKAFARLGIPADQIVGTRIKRGTLIMYAGDTGISAYNHLHTYVHTAEPFPDQSAPSSSLKGNGPDYPAGTIPFVYKEITRTFKPNGVPKALTYYTSQNEKQGEIPPMALFHPLNHQNYLARSNVVPGYVPRQLLASTANGAQIDDYATSEKDYFKGAFIQTLGPDAQQRLITAYEQKKSGGNEQNLIEIDPAWTTNPPINTDFKIEWLIRSSGSDHVQLDPMASRRSEDYVGTHIFVEFTNAAGQTLYQYKQIIRYNSDTQTAYIDGTWEWNPPAGSRFQIGAKAYQQATEEEKHFAYLSAGTNPATPVPFADGRAPYTYTTIARFPELAQTGRVQGGGTSSGNTLTLENSASDQDDAYNGRHLIIKRGTRVIQYKQITDYTGASRQLKIADTWDLALVPGAFGDQYEIGAAPYAQASEQDKASAYLASKNGDQVQDFADGHPPYLYSTFKIWN